jgi:glutamyl-tRNA synthetase
MLLAWLQIRAMRGRFVLRIENLDDARTRPGADDAILRDLGWLGFDWDEGPDVGGPHGPYRQSERSDLYEEALQRLRAAGLVYPCSCSRKEVREAAGAPHGGESPYPGRCRDGPRRPGLPDSALSLRVRVPLGERVDWDDRMLGPRSQVPSLVCGDFIVRGKGGGHVYQLAVVADDIAMGVTHVLRGEDLAESTARQVLLWRWLGATPPLWAHAPLRRDEEGQRLAKRRGSPAVAALREAGEAPERVVGGLARDLGLIDDRSRGGAAALRPSELVEALRERRPELLASVAGVYGKK